MSLRTQLLIVSLLTLALPWAGCQYVREMEGVLRKGQEDALLATARAITHVLANQPEALYRYPEHMRQLGDTELDVYAHQLQDTVTIDGFADDWEPFRHDFVSLPARGIRDPYPALPEQEGRVRYIAGVDAGHLYLFVYVEDAGEVLYHNPTRGGTANGDHLMLHLRTEGRDVERYWIRTAAPGSLHAVHETGPKQRRRVRRERRIQGHWQPHANGYQVELRVPLAMLGPEFGFTVVDLEPGDGGRPEPASWSGTVVPEYQAPLGYLIYPPPMLSSLLEPFRQPGLKVRVTDRSGRLLASVGQLSLSNWLAGLDEPAPRLQLHDFYRAILDTVPRKHLIYLEQNGRLRGTFIEATLLGQEQAIWRRQADARKAIIAVAHPVAGEERVLGAVILEQSSDAVLTLTNHAITQLFNTTFLAIGLAIAGLLGFATILSLRIRRLRDATERSVTTEGEIHHELIPVGTGDELGDLSRSFASLLRRLDDYNNYLQTLASKLSHELRTPLAVVSSSLENLEQENLTEQARICSQRAREGTGRLRAILTALSEATRVEQSIQATEPEPFDLREVAEGSVHSYQAVFPGYRFRFVAPDRPCPMTGSPDLIVQMLDKLVDNAVDFCPDQGWIEIALERERGQYRLSVANEGPALPEHMQEQLFDQLVSVREKRGDSPHLGLGLYIVKLIAEHHGGSISAHNLPDASGVEFQVVLPSRRGP